MDSHFISRHQTGVKADDIQMKIGVFLLNGVERIVDFVDGQTVVIGGFIKADAPHGAAAVIPENENIAVGGVGVGRP